MADVPPISLTQLRALAEVAGLDLADDRLDLLLPQIQSILAGVERLDELGLDEVEPEITFRAAWRDDEP